MTACLYAFFCPFSLLSFGFLHCPYCTVRSIDDVRGEYVHQLCTPKDGEDSARGYHTLFPLGHFLIPLCLACPRCGSFGLDPSVLRNIYRFYICTFPGPLGFLLPAEGVSKKRERVRHSNNMTK
ncbi:uncharacterized protein F4817DRAFT_70203 [Daldinia loculata]|uniref:uncharacterized protein n=1 Tax=Daldinia loculata TaxID=103429 RepID=UPI0020C55292|nr:uncharacterized protein F4817DRAFT_70203 [Daldinia loculata]KAI1648301.1 hypothetical protein F4817DRAFT_70203 [Daldinia loculata]